MADGLDLSEMVRRTVQANARFYKGWLDLSLEYFRGISEIFGGPVSGAPASAVAETDTGAGVLVLEGEEGATVRGAFLVTNDLGRNVMCELVTSEFADSSGASVRAKTTFEPPRVQLAPGAQRVVTAAIVIDGRLAAGVAYTGEFSIKGMDGFAVPVVLRRQHGIEEPSDKPGQPANTTPTSNKPSAKPAATAKPAAKAPQGKRVAKQKE